MCDETMCNEDVYDGIDTDKYSELVSCINGIHSTDELVTSSRKNTLVFRFSIQKFMEGERNVTLSCVNLDLYLCDKVILKEV